MRTTGVPMRRSPLKAKRAKQRRVAVLRDRRYLDWLRERFCPACRATMSNPEGLGFLPAGWQHQADPAHGPSNGTGSKGPDNEAIPLCRAHHREQHRIGWPAFEAKYGFSREREAAGLYARYLGEPIIFSGPMVREGI